VQKFSYMRFEPEGITTNPEIPFAKSMPDYIMRWLASRFLDADLQEELGIMTQAVRAKKSAEEASFSLTGDTSGPAANVAPVAKPATGNGGAGNGTAGAPGNGAPRASASSATRPPSAAFTDSPPVVPAVRVGLDLGPGCGQCGGMMQRTGSCYTCSSCGFNTGCG
jgi:ribonucleoside-diphosphate reductase alpha chain